MSAMSIVGFCYEVCRFCLLDSFEDIDGYTLLTCVRSWAPHLTKLSTRDESPTFYRMWMSDVLHIVPAHGYMALMLANGQLNGRLSLGMSFAIFLLSVVLSMMSAACLVGLVERAGSLNCRLRFPSSFRHLGSILLLYLSIGKRHHQHE